MIDPLLIGGGTFTADVRRPDALTAVVVRSWEAHGRLLSVDAEEARAMPGVRVVLTAADLGEVPVVPIRSFSVPGLERALQPVLATDRVRYVGEPVAVVVADDALTAEDAAERVAPEIERLPPVAAPNRDGADLLCRWTTDCGDVDTAFRAAAVVVEDEFRSSRHTGVPLEPRALVAEWDADGGVDLWGPTKFADFTRDTVARWFDVSAADVRIHRVSVGGMFGVRGELYPEDFLVPWAARVTGRPVRWVEDRREHFLAINHAPEVRTRFALAMAANGRLLGFRADVRVDMGAYARTNGARLPMLAIEELPGPYAWDAFAVTADGHRTTKTPIGSVRAPLALEQTFVRERAIDRAARELGLDPVDVRRRSVVAADAMPYVRRYGGDLHHQTFDGGDYPAALDALVATARLEELRAERDSRRAAGETVGVGLALFLAHSGLGSDERVHVTLDRGRFTIVTAASDSGQGLDRMAALVAARALRVEPGAVVVRSGAVHDTAMTRGTFSSRGTIFVGNAVRAACARIEELARERVAELAGVAIDDVEPAPGGFAVDGRYVPWTAAGDLAAAGEHHADEAAYGVGGHVAFVRVDSELGDIAVERLAVVYDCGRAVDPLAVRGQLVGGAVHGVGITLQEALRFDDAAQPLVASFMDYLPPGAMEAPQLRVAVLEHGTSQNPLGVKGTGEAGVIGVGAAVANAVADATGIDLTELPLPAAALRARARPMARS